MSPFSLCVFSLLAACFIEKGQSRMSVNPEKIEPKVTKVLTLNCSHDDPDTTAVISIQIKKIDDADSNRPHSSSARGETRVAGLETIKHRLKRTTLAASSHHQVKHEGTDNHQQTPPKPPPKAPQPPKQTEPYRVPGFKQASYRNHHEKKYPDIFSNSGGYQNLKPHSYRVKRSVEDNVQNQEKFGDGGGLDFFSDFKTERRKKRSAEYQTAKKSIILQGSLVREKRSVFGTFGRRTAVATLKTATLGGGNIVTLVPDNGRIKGHGRLARPAYLSVDIEDPDENDKGKYVCTITRMVSGGSREDTYSVFALALSGKSIQALADRVSRLETQLPIMSAMGSLMQNAVQADSKRSKEMQEGIEKLKKENEDLVASVEDLKEKFKVLSDRTTALMEEQKARPPPVAIPASPPQKVSTETTRPKPAAGKISISLNNNPPQNAQPPNGGVPNQNNNMNNNYGQNGNNNNNHMPPGNNNYPYGNYNNYPQNGGFGGFGGRMGGGAPYQQQQPRGMPQGYNPGGGFAGGYRGYHPMAPMGAPHLKTDDLTQITARMDHLENTRITALEQDLSTVKLQWVTPMAEDLGNLKVYINVTVRSELEKLENLNLPGMSTKLDTIQSKTIDLIQKMSNVEHDMSQLQKALDAGKH